MTDDNPWEVTIDLRSVALGFVLGTSLLVGLHAIATAGPYLDAECTVENGEVVEASFTNPHEHVSIEEMDQICRDRTDAVHPLVYDLRLALLGPDYTDYDATDTQVAPL
jgi:hypothetical protein